MSTSGTLHQYFKQPSQNADKLPATSECIIIDDLPQESASVMSSAVKRKGGVTNGDAGKRRKLSLSTLRAKQSHIAPLPCVSIVPVAEQQAGDPVINCTKSPPQSVKDVLSYPKSSCNKKLSKLKSNAEKDPHNIQVDKIDSSSTTHVKDRLKWSKGSVKHISESPSISSNSDKGIKNSGCIATESKICNGSECSELEVMQPSTPKGANKKTKGNKIDSILATQVNDQLKLSTSPVKLADSPIKSKRKSRRRATVLSDSDEEVEHSIDVKSENYDGNKSPELEVTTPSKSKVPCKLTEEIKVDSSNLANQVNDQLKLSTSPVKSLDSPIKVNQKSRRDAAVLSDSDEEIKSSLEVESKKRGRSQSSEVGVCQPSSSIDEVADLDTSVGRRSTRTRKPVERFTIVLSDREDEGRLHFSMINNISYLV